MVYYSDNELVIRTMCESDPERICKEEIAQGWDAKADKYFSRLSDMTDGISVALVADINGAPAGYVNVYINSRWGAFGGSGMCEIVDFGVLEKYRCRGIGSRLMDTAEKIAAEYSDSVYLGVGMHNGYGSAQRMYVKRGYIPDGSGVWYGDKIAEPYMPCVNDDDLVLYMSKRLRYAT